MEIVMDSDSNLTVWVMQSIVMKGILILLL